MTIIKNIDADHLELIVTKIYSVVYLFDLSMSCENRVNDNRLLIGKTECNSFLLNCLLDLLVELDTLVLS